MATITAGLERSLQKCSLTQFQQPHNSHAASVVLANSSSNDEHQNQAHPTLDLNSHISLPYHWEQCLDLKTGEIYYINWRNGMKAKEDPRSTTEDHYYCYYSSSSSDDDDSSSYDSEDSSNNNNNKEHDDEDEEEEEEEEEEEKKGDVLVVAGCKSCLMYFMVPKHLEDCPKCSTTGQLLHFDRSENDIP